jgi:hypothetical protein
MNQAATRTDQADRPDLRAMYSARARVCGAILERMIAGGIDRQAAYRTLQALGLIQKGRNSDAGKA